MDVKGSYKIILYVMREEVQKSPALGTYAAICIEIAFLILIKNILRMQICSYYKFAQRR